MDPVNEKSLFDLVNDISLKFFGKPYTDKVTFNHRLRTTGGRYLPTERVIELNPKYVEEMEASEFIGIIKHELCHYHLHIEGKGYKHGDEDFKRLLKKTGSPRHCSPLPSQVNAYKYLYICKDCHYQYKRKRKVDITKYRCGKCRGRLILSEE
ncbi:SprT family protein [Oceanobacillus sp. Castelsardo]|uniref:SprT family protein n=1 Tax=Oceanobacillus sp. Castelsardo TaxID=1851204 RepID=UPI000837B52E|nr:SprT family protein [Oceanobacillus sp. Castelsardo]